MSRSKEELQGVTKLGNQHTVYAQDYDPSLLETFVNKHPDRDYFVKFNCPEFTSLCPMTGQPDYATIYISYVPGVRMVESKSLKLYLTDQSLLERKSCSWMRKALSGLHRSLDCC